jgi:hypothetical protein
MEEPRRPPHYRSAHARVVIEEEEKASPVSEQIENGVRIGKRINYLIKGVLAILAVCLFSLIDSPIRPFMVGTAILMGLIVLLWPMLKKDG